MDVSARRAFSLLKELAYVRQSGSEEELNAAKRLAEECLSCGVEATIEEFPIEAGTVENAKVSVIEPYQKDYPCEGFRRAKSTPDEGIDLDFYYAENLLPAHMQNCGGKAVLVNGRTRKEAYEQLVKAKAGAVICFTGTVIDRPSETDIGIRSLPDMLVENSEKLTMFNVRAADAQEMVRRGAKKLHLELSCTDFEAKSHNVCATIPGTEFPDEIISFGAHFDSVPFSTGVYDNMSGSVIIMELLRYFAKNPPKRTLKFNWYGSEEVGLNGSRAWLDAHEAELDKHVLMINVDVAGPILGENVAPILATEGVVGYVDALMRENGFACACKLDLYSSDCIPFADRGIPAINLCRFGANGTAFIHDRRDNLKNGFMSEAGLDITLQQALLLAKHVVNAKVFPIKKEIAREIKDKLAKSPFKKKLADAPKADVPAEKGK